MLSGINHLSDQDALFHAKFFNFFSKLSESRQQPREDFHDLNETTSWHYSLESIKKKGATEEETGFHKLHC